MRDTIASKMDLPALLQFLTGLSNEEKVTLGLSALGLAAKGSKSAYKKLFSKKQKQQFESLVRRATDEEIKRYGGGHWRGGAVKKAAPKRVAYKTAAPKKAAAKKSAAKKAARKT